MSSLEELPDPRIAVLIVWAIFFLVFIILPGVCIRCLSCFSSNSSSNNHDEDFNLASENNEANAARGSGFDEMNLLSGAWDSYFYLSGGQQQQHKRNEIDIKRLEGLRNYIGKFSVELKKEEHMMCCDENGEIVHPPTISTTAKANLTVGDVDKDIDTLNEDYKVWNEVKDSLIGTDLRQEEQEQHTNRQEEEKEEERVPQDDVVASSDEHIPAADEEMGGLQSKKDGVVLESASSSSTSNEIISGKFDIVAPAGKLSIRVDDHSTAKLVEIVDIKHDSPLHNKVQLGDKVLALDGKDVQRLSSISVSMLLMSKRNESERKITLYRGNTMDLEDGNEYTHVRIPLPGYDYEGYKVKEKVVALPLKSCTTRRFPFFKAKAQVVAVDDTEQGDEDHDIEAANGSAKNGADDADDANKKSDQRRNVPACCAICLGEFEISEKISWSSNHECTHVYHQDCIVKWLNTLGRKQCKYQRITDDMSVLQLLNYGLECPCCRQDFVSKLVLVEDEVYGDDAAIHALSLLGL